MADLEFPVLNGVMKKMVDLGDGTHAEVVAIGGLDGNVEITGDANIDTSALETAIGAPSDAAWNGEPGPASAIAILKAIHAQLVLIAGE